MKSMLLCFMLLLSNQLFSQTLVATVQVEGVRAAYIDRPGDLYILQKNKVLKKFDAQGKLLTEQTFQQDPTLFDPRDGARAFLYFKESQQCFFYSEEIKQVFSIDPHYAVDPHMVCSSGDYNIWILDHSDWSLKRVNPSQSTVVTDALIDQQQFKKTSPEFIYMREYQNFLFLVEKNTGILVFNSLGIQIKKIPVTGVEYLNFLGEELYYKKGDKLHFYDLFDGSEREQLIDPACKYALLTDARTYVVYESKADIFQNN